MPSQQPFTTGPRLAGLVSILLSAVSPAVAQGVLTTIAGTDWLFPADGRPAVNAPLNTTSGLDVTADQQGNFYIADSENQMIFRVGADGIINVVAGNGILFPSGDGGLAVNAGLANPLSVAVDTAGNLYIGEYGGTIRKVTPDGIITKIAGTDFYGFSGDGGPAINAQFYAPTASHSTRAETSMLPIHSMRASEKSPPTGLSERSQAEARVWTMAFPRQTTASASRFEFARMPRETSTSSMWEEMKIPTIAPIRSSR